MKKEYILSLLLAGLITFSGCSAAGSAVSSSSESGKTEEVSVVLAESSKTELAGPEPASEAAKGEPVESSAVNGGSDMFTNNDLEIGYDEETSAKITLSGNSASSDSNGVKISDGTVTITEEGTYLLSGTLNDGQIVVSVGDTEKVRLVLDGAQITSSTSAAIYVMEADKVFLTTASGSENTLANGGEYVAIDNNNIDAAVFSKADLTLNGAGTLKINAAAGHGVVSKDDLVLTSGTYEITAANHGLSGKDSVRIANGTYTITSGKDGIQAENADDADKGFLYIAGGGFAITAGGDGMSAGAYLQIEDGEFTINTGEGSASVTMVSDTMEFGRKGGFFEETTTLETEDTVSQKGVKTDGTLTITAGSFVMDTEDDSLHANGDVLVTGGSFTLRSGDDAVHSDAGVTIQNGDFAIAYCYEGIEGLTVTIDGGTFTITAVDDGINSAGGADSSGFGGRRPGQEQFFSESDSSITVNGGTFVIVSNGDCLDSNGALTINGGSLTLTCNGNGNTALDCDGTYTHNGGDITTNDGSESNPGQMGGRGGRKIG